MSPPQAPPPTPQPPPSPGTRELAKDPAEREKQLSTVRGEATTILNLLAMVISRLTPTMPMEEAEKVAISEPLEQVLYKYNGALPCEWQLAIALGFVALPRYGEIKRKREAAPKS